LAISIHPENRISIIKKRGQHMNNNNEFRFKKLCVALAACSAGLAHAELEEVIVTSNKLAGATVQDMPSAVKVIDAEELLNRGALDFVDVIGSVPGLQFQDSGPGDKDYIIRGTNSSGASLVAVYFDETPITGSNAQDGGGRNIDLKLIDMEGVEVLRGPQGTQYGASAMSGLIRHRSVKPNAESLGGFISAELSDTNEGGSNYTVSGALNVPLISDVLGARITAYRVDNEGWIDQLRAAGGPREDINNEETQGGRIALRYTPSDALTLDLMYLRQDLETEGSSRYTPKGNMTFGDANSGFPAVPVSRDYENQDITRSPWEEELDIVSATLSYEFDAGTLTLTASQWEREIQYSFDSSPILFFFGVPIPGITLQPQSREVDFAEVRFASSLGGRFEYLVGAAIRNEDTAFETNVVTMDANGNAEPFRPGIENDRLANPNGTTFFGRYVNNELEQTAYFGEISFDLTDQINIIAGLRYFDSEQSSVEGTIHDFGSAAPAGPFNNSADDDAITSKLAVSYQVSDSLTWYANFSQGFRVGGLNNSQSLFVDDVPVSYEHDKLDNFEFGFKSQMENGARLDGAIYLLDWTDIQVETVAGSAFPYLANAGEAQVTGIEIDAYLPFNDQWALQLGGSWNEAELTEDQPAADAGADRGLDGDRIPNVPELQFFAALSYQQQIAWGDLNARLDMQYQGDRDTLFDTQNARNVELDAYTLVNANVNLKTESGWTLSVFARNLTDEMAEFDAVNTDQDPFAIVGSRPRTIGFSVRKDFL
jgi:outer membrane receptor protein involved in Fe transport